MLPTCPAMPIAMVNLCRDEVTATLKHKIDQARVSRLLPVPCHHLRLL